MYYNYYKNIQQCVSPQFDKLSHILQGYYWTDGSLFLLSKFEDLDVVARNTLETSYFSSRFAPEAVYKSYVSRMKSKLTLVKLFNSSNTKPNNVCVVVILTVITKPAWSHLHCDQKLLDNYFLCESRVSNNRATTYYRHNHHCHKLHTYYLRKCWFIQHGNARTLAIDTSTLYQSFYLMFSAWAYGDTSRNHVQIYIGSIRNLLCISTDGLPTHFGKTWMVVPCKQNNVIGKSYKLGQAHPATYKYICNEKMHFNCKDNTCVLASYLCDNIYDCPDKSDEYNDNCVESNIQENRCSDFHFSCRSGGRIHATQQCDDYQHCDDGSDEVLCVDIQASIHNGGLNTDTVEPYFISVIKYSRNYTSIVFVLRI